MILIYLKIYNTYQVFRFNAIGTYWKLNIFFGSFQGDMCTYDLVSRDHGACKGLVMPVC